MAITAAMIKELRERTGAGMMDCKKVLTEVDGDMDAAVEALRKKGAAAAEKKSGRIAAEGRIFSAHQDDASVLLEVNCETDFVAKDESFGAFCEQVAQAILQNDPNDAATLATLELESGQSVETARQELIIKIGENINIRRFVRMESGQGAISSYLHGVRIGVMVKLNGGTAELGRDVAMHIAASRPLCISEQDMDSGIVEKEKEIFVAQAAESGKPPEIVEKMVSGRISKFLKENTLLGQPFVKNPDQTVGELLNQAGADVVAMERFEVGEGLEKRSEDFVAEVMAQANA